MAEIAAIRDFQCSPCGAPVGYSELYPPEVPRAAGRGGEHPGRRRQGHGRVIDMG